MPVKKTIRQQRSASVGEKPQPNPLTQHPGLIHWVFFAHPRNRNFHSYQHKSGTEGNTTYEKVRWLIQQLEDRFPEEHYRLDWKIKNHDCSRTLAEYKSEL